MIEILNLENIIPMEMLYSLGPDAVRAVMQSVVAGARDHWIQLASKEFHTSRTEYIAGIQEVDWRDESTAVISLVGILPNILESGMDTMYMHEVMLRPGAKGVHDSLDGGRYRAIPFRHRTPGSGAHGAPMGSALEKVLGPEGAKQLGRDVYRAAKKLTAYHSDPYSKNKKDERLDTSKITRRGKQVIVPKIQSYHASDPYKGMIREEKTYKNKTQSQYMTFRTIAVGPDDKPRGGSPWVRPKSDGRFLARQVSEYVATRLAPQAFSAYVAGLKV